MKWSERKRATTRREAVSIIEDAIERKVDIKEIHEFAESFEIPLVICVGRVFGKNDEDYYESSEYEESSAYEESNSYEEPLS